MGKWLLSFERRKKGVSFQLEANQQVFTKPLYSCITCYHGNVISLSLNKIIEKQFRYTLGSVRGTHKGNLKFAIEEAMYFWVQYYEEKYGRFYNSQIMKKELDKMRKEKEEEMYVPGKE
jgi:hypothetical protein